MLSRQTQDDLARAARSLPLQAVFLVLLTLIAYQPAFLAEFVWDDEAITYNPLLRSPGNFAKIWTDPHANPNEEHYWPVTYTVLWVGQRIWGNEAFGYHALNIALHIGIVLLLWRLLRCIGAPGAWLVAAIFAVHPTHVESVAWAIELKDVLSGFFYMLAANLFFSAHFPSVPPVEARPARKPALLYLLALMCFAIAMLSKSVIVTLPAALLIVIWWKRGRIGPRDVVAVLPFFALGLLLALADVYLTRQIHPLDFYLPWLRRIVIAGRAAWFYIGKLLWPTHLVAIYPHWSVNEQVVWQYFYAAAFCVLLLALWRGRGRFGRGPFACMMFYLVTISPALGFIPFSYQDHSFVANRFQYIAGAGIIVLAGGAVALLVRRGGPMIRMGLIALCAVVLAMLTAINWQQASTYEDRITLFAYNIRENPRAWGAHYNLAQALAREGRLREAEYHYMQSLAIWPEFPSGHSALGLTLLRVGEIDRAVDHLRRATQLDPEKSMHHHNLAHAYESQGRVELALFHIARAADLAHDKVRSRLAYARLLARVGQTTQSLAQYEKILQIQPINQAAREEMRRLTTAK